MKRRTFDILFWAVIVGIAAITLLVVLRFSADKVFEWRYPKKYESMISQAAKLNDLPESFVYAVVHTESTFDPMAVSSVDARGLMQITRDTFDWIQHKMGLTERIDYDENAFDPAINVRLGTYLLKLLYEEYGSYDLALCAYHAGRGNLNKWLSDPKLSPDGETLSEIPFGDTAWYVARVGKTRAVYQKRYGME